MNYLKWQNMKGYQGYVEHRLTLRFKPLVFLKIWGAEEVCCSVFSVIDSSYSPFVVSCWRKDMLLFFCSLHFSFLFELGREAMGGFIHDQDMMRCPKLFLRFSNNG